jgi:hypothetical protein
MPNIASKINVVMKTVKDDFICFSFLSRMMPVSYYEYIFQ